MLVNVKGVFLGCKYGIPALRRAGGGSIINMASFVAVMGAATPQLAYTASKGAVLAMSRELAAIHARENIRVNALCPGPLHTELLMKYLDTDEKKARRLVHIPHRSLRPGPGNRQSRPVSGIGGILLRHRQRLHGRRRHHRRLHHARIAPRRRSVSQARSPLSRNWLTSSPLISYNLEHESLALY